MQIDAAYASWGRGMGGELWGGSRRRGEGAVVRQGMQQPVDVA